LVASSANPVRIPETRFSPIVATRIAAVRLPAQPDGLADEPGQLPGDREEAGLGQPLIVGTPIGSGQFRRELVGLGAGFGPGCRVRATPH